MSRKVRIGITADNVDKYGNFVFPGPGLKLLDALPGVEYKVLSERSPEATPAQIKGYDLIITSMPKWTAASVAGNDQLLAIHRTGVGYDMVNVPDMTAGNVMLTITIDAVRRPVAQAIITFMLALAGNMMQKDRITRAGQWSEREKYLGMGVAGRTLGSFGVGNIGHDTFKLAMPFEMKHIAYDPFVTQDKVNDVNVKLVDMDTVLRESDFLNISCPLSEKTYHLIGEKELKKMKKTAYLINTSRGPVVDEKALYKALKEGWIKGAAIDVFEQEPTPADNPILKLDNIIVAPHSLAHTDQLRLTMWDEIVGQIKQIVSGEMPKGLVNKEVWNSPEFKSRMKRFLAATK